MQKVSVIIPCYNQGQYLQEAINSVKNSTYDNIEIIVVNDGSTDNTKEIIDNLENEYPDIKFITIQNSGVCKTRNLGIANSTGDYILPLDADDKIGTEYIEKAVQVLDNNKNTGLVYCNAEFFGSIQKKWDLKPATTENMLVQNRIFPSAMFRKETFNQIGGYKPEMETGCEDWELWLSIIESGAEIYKLPETLFYYRKSENERTKISHRPLNYIKIRLNIIKFHKNLYKQYGIKVYFKLLFMVVKNLAYNIYNNF